jgi:tetratricopeptide (TPR) repeat protein
MARGRRRRNDLDSLPRIPARLVGGSQPNAHLVRLGRLGQAIDMDPIASHLRQGHLEAAYVVTVQKGPDRADPDYLALRALTRWHLGHDAAAMADASRAIQVAPNDPLVRTVHGLTSLSVGALHDAWADAETARGLAPDEPLGIGLLALLLDEHQQQDDAIALLNAAITRDPFNNDLRLVRANVLSAEPHSALSDLDIVLARSPEHVQAMVARALIDEDTAQRLLDRAVELAPHYATAFAFRALRRALTDPEAARADADYAYRLSQGSAESILVIVMLDLGAGDLEGARNRLAGLHQGQPSTVATAWTGYAEVAFARGKEAAALESLNRALDARPTHGHALALRAMIRLEEDDHDGARRDAREALARDSNDAIALSVEASLAMLRQDWRATVDHADHALRQDPHSVIALFDHGLASAHLGDFAASRQRALELRQMSATDLADPLEGLVRKLEATAPGQRSALTSTREAADIIKTAIDIARAFFG